MGKNMAGYEGPDIVMDSQGGDVRPDVAIPVFVALANVLYNANVNQNANLNTNANGNANLNANKNVNW